LLFFRKFSACERWFSAKNSSPSGALDRQTEVRSLFLPLLFVMPAKQIVKTLTRIQNRRFRKPGATIISMRQLRLFLGFGAVRRPLSTTHSLCDQVVLQYFEGGSTPVVEITGLASSFATDFPQEVAPTGYLLKCNAATPCAPIALGPVVHISD